MTVHSIIAATSSNALPMSAVDCLLKYLSPPEATVVSLVDRCWNNFILGRREGPESNLRGGYQPALIPVASTKSAQWRKEQETTLNGRLGINVVPCPYVCPVINYSSLKLLNNAESWWMPEYTFHQIFRNKRFFSNDQRMTWWKSLPKDAAAHALEYLTHSDMNSLSQTCKSESFLGQRAQPEFQLSEAYHPSLIPTASKAQLEAHNSEQTPLTYEEFLKLKEIHAHFGVPLSPCLQISHLRFVGARLNSDDLEEIARLFPNMTTLNLSFCQDLTDLSPLAQMHSLQKLDLSQCGLIADVTPLALLTSLKELSLGYCSSITDLSPIASLHELSKLRLNECVRVTDFSPLIDLTYLQFLDLSGTQIAALTSIADLRNLQTLVMNNCSQMQSSQLANLEKLTRLKVLQASLELDDVGMDRITELPLLEELYLSNCSNVTDRGLAHLERLKYIQRLELKGCSQISNLTPLGALISLRSLLLVARELRDARSLARLTNLKNLTLFCRNVPTDQQLFLQGMTKLEGLITDVALDDRGLSSLSMLSNLKKLNLANSTHATDVGLHLLGRLAKLETLVLKQCGQITDVGLGSLSNIGSLVYLSVIGSRNLTNSGLMSQLRSPELQHLNLGRGSHITREGVAQFRNAGSNIRLAFSDE